MSTAARMSIEARFRLVRPDFTLDVNLALPSRGVTGLFGVSGSGKTTLLRCLAGLERAPDGMLRIDDETWQDGDVFLPVHRRPVGLVFQDTALFPHLDVRGNLEFGWSRIPAASRRVSLDDAIELLGIEQLLARRPEKLSGGEQQRVAIARALAVSPRLLLLDEPLAALDAPRKREILPWLERLHSALDMPVVYVSHAIDEMVRLADHLVVLAQGRVHASGPLATVMAQADLPLSSEEDLGVVIEATLAERDERWHLARADFAGGSLWVRDHCLAGGQGAGTALGSRLRVRVLARDVSLALAPHADTSIQNLLQGTVREFIPAGHPAISIVRLETDGGVPLLARLTARSVDALGLVVGQSVWVQVKSAAVLG